MTHTDTDHLQRLLSVCNEERLIRFIYLLCKKNYTDTALLLKDELDRREHEHVPVETL